MSGKGSKRRPEDHKKDAENWDLIFGKKDKSKENNDKLEKEKKHNES